MPCILKRALKYGDAGNQLVYEERSWERQELLQNIRVLAIMWFEYRKGLLPRTSEYLDWLPFRMV